MEIIPLYKGKRKNILIISGGGLKGFAALGSLKCLVDNEIIVFPEIFAGTSAGAAICLLINIGYSPRDIYDLLEQIDYSDIIKYLDPENILFDPCFGLSSPEPLLEIIYGFMKKKNINKNITFEELYKKTQSKLIITGTCINDVTLKYFSVDTYPKMQILKALRISISIPFIFRPYSFENKLWVDGGCIDNFPIDLFTDKLDDVVGIYMDEHYENLNEITEIQDYIIRIFTCVFKGLNFNKLELFKKYFVHIILTGQLSTKWDMNLDEKKHLFDQGYQSAQNFVDLQNYDN